MRMHKSSIIENIYNITRHREDYINPTVDGEMSWRSVCSMTQIQRMLWRDGRIRFMRFQQEDAQMNHQKMVCEIGIGPYNLPRFDGTDSVDTFLAHRCRIFP
jgi:hypothetical protein